MALLRDLTAPDPIQIFFKPEEVERGACLHLPPPVFTEFLIETLEIPTVRATVIRMVTEHAGLFHTSNAHCRPNHDDFSALRDHIDARATSRSKQNHSYLRTVLRHWCERHLPAHSQSWAVAIPYVLARMDTDLRYKLYSSISLTKICQRFPLTETLHAGSLGDAVSLPPERGGLAAHPDV